MYCNDFVLRRFNHTIVSPIEMDCHYLTGCRLLTIDDAPNNRKKGKWDIGNELGNCGIHSGNENEIENKE